MAPKRTPKRGVANLGNQYARKPNPKATLSLTVSPVVKDRLRRAAQGQGISASEWTEAAILARLDAKKKAPPLPPLCASCGELFVNEEVYEGDYGRCCAEPSERQP